MAKSKWYIRTLYLRIFTFRHPKGWWPQCFHRSWIRRQSLFVEHRFRGSRRLSLRRWILQSSIIIPRGLPKQSAIDDFPNQNVASKYSFRRQGLHFYFAPSRSWLNECLRNCWGKMETYSRSWSNFDKCDLYDERPKYWISSQSRCLRPVQRWLRWL